MYTIIKDNKTNGKINFTTKQYTVGLYCIINNDPAQQFNIDESEEDFHIKIRETAIENKDTIIEGSIIENYKGKYNINQFNK